MALLFDSWLVSLTAALATLLAAVYLFFTHRYSYWRRRGVAHPTPTFPFGNIGDMALMRRSMGEVYESIYRRHAADKLVGVYQLASPILLVCDPDYIKTVLVKDFAHFHDRGIHFDEKHDPISAHLLVMEGSKWKHMRYKLTPTFTSGKMKMMFPTLVRCGTELQKYLLGPAERGETLEVKDVLAKYSTDVIATCAFGIQSNSLANPDSEFREMGRRAFEPTFTSGLNDVISLLAPRLATLLKIPSVPRDVSDFFIGVVKETVSYREANDVTRNDFMQLLIRIKNKKSVVDDEDPDAKDADTGENYYDLHGMTDVQVAAQAFVFFLAGFETSSTTMSYALYELALNPRVQEQLRDEVDSVLRDHGGEFTYEAMTDMTYLDMVIAETLRKHPPVSVLIRKCSKEYKVPDRDLVIEKDTILLIPAQAIQNDPQYYPEPQKFDPDRFTEKAKSERHQFVYLPFGEGPRNCIGSRFGLMQTKVGLASLIVKYQFNVCATTPIPLVLDPKAFIPTPIGGMNLQITARK